VWRLFRQGRGRFATAGIVSLREKTVNGCAIISKRRERRMEGRGAVFQQLFSIGQ
jgi:hypothetical protein